MQTKKMVLMVLAMFGLVAVWAVNSHAAAATYTCSVNWAGPATSPAYKIAIRLTYVSGTPIPGTKTKTFYAPATREKEFLAVALTAMANNKKVSALVDFVTLTSTTVFNLYLLP